MEDEPDPDYLFIGVMGLWLIISVLSNFGVLAVVLCNKKTQTVTSIFMCNLALSDIFLAAFVIPQSVHDLSHQEDYHEGALACKMINFLPVLCITGSVYTLVAMSHERCRAIVYHAKHQVSVGKSKILCLCVWGVSFVVSIPSIVEYRVYELPSLLNDTDDHTVSAFTDDPHHDDHPSLRCGSAGVNQYVVVANGIFLLFISYVLPMLVMVYNYGKLVHFIFAQSYKIEPKESTGAQGTTTAAVGTGSRTLSKRRMKIVKMLIIVTLLFCICWAPYFSILIMAKIGGKDDSSEADSFLNKFRLCLTIFSTSYNFVTYFKYNEGFRAGFLNLFCRCIQRKGPEPSQTQTQGISVNN